MILTRLRQPPVHLTAKLLSCRLRLSPVRSRRQFGFATAPETTTCTLTPRLFAASSACVAGRSSKFQVATRIFARFGVSSIDRTTLLMIVRRAPKRSGSLKVTPDDGTYLLRLGVAALSAALS